MTINEIAIRLREQDRQLGTALPPEVQVRCRRNRSTLGSLRMSRGRPAVWRFTVDAELLAGDPQGALDLGLLLLHRARRQPPPASLRSRLEDTRASWSRRQGTRKTRGLRPDAALQRRLAMVAQRAMPELATASLPGIAWVASTSKRVLGRYDERARRIDVHAALGMAAVPAHVLDNLIYHELLHAVLGPRRQGSRLIHHHSEFRRLERSFPGFREAEVWARECWPGLVRRYLRQPPRLLD